MMNEANITVTQQPQNFDHIIVRDHGIDVTNTLKAKEIKEISHNLANVINILHDIEYPFVWAFNSKESAEVFLMKNELIPLRLMDKNGEMHETAMNIQEVLRVLDWAIDPPENTNDSYGKQYLLEDFQKLRNGDQKAFMNFQDAVQERLETLEKYETRRGNVRELVQADNEKEHIVDALAEAANLTFPSDLNPENQRFDKYIVAFASGSTTASSSSDDPDQQVALNNLKETQNLIQTEAKKSTKLTSELISEINLTLTKNTENNGGHPGEFRKPGVEVQGRNCNYVAGMHVNEEITKLCEWVNQELEKCGDDKRKVIEIAARAYSWSVSIHPFKDGNGRTCRMIANFILISNQLPPAIHSKEKTDAAVFGDQDEYSKSHSEPQSNVLKHMVKGMIEADKLLKQGDLQ